MARNMAVADIPNRVYDPSCVGEYMRCPIRFYFKYVLGLEPKEPSPALTFGSAIHEAMNVLYEDDNITDVDMEAAVNVLSTLPAAIGDEKRSRERGEAIIRGYFEKYKGVTPFKTLAREAEFKIPLPGGAWCAGRLDRVVEWDGRPWVWDYKTASSLAGHWQESFRPSVQMDTYCRGVKEVFGDCAGVIIDGLLVSKTKVEFARPISDRTPAELENALGRFEGWVEEIERAMVEKKFRYSTGNCHSFFFQACEFTGVCMYGMEFAELKFVKGERYGKGALAGEGS